MRGTHKAKKGIVQLRKRDSREDGSRCEKTTRQQEVTEVRHQRVQLLNLQILFPTAETEDGTVQDTNKYTSYLGIWKNFIYSFMYV